MVQKRLNGVFYNQFDAGNYLWGATMSKLGFSAGAAMFAAQINEFTHGRFDATTDQRAIWNGATGSRSHP